MRRALALVVVLALVVFARKAGVVQSERAATMALGFVLIVAALVGEAGARLRLPRITGYLLVGLALSPSALNVLSADMTSALRLVNGLAVGLIAFGAGMELDMPSLRRDWRGILRHGGVLLAVVFGGLFAAALVASPYLPFLAEQPWNVRVAASLMLAAVMATFSPTVTMAILAETGARGPLAARVLALVVLGDLGIVLLFTLASTLARALAGSGLSVATITGHLLWEIFGSLLIGAASGVGLYLYRRFVDRRSGLLVAGVCLVLAEIGARAGLSPLLACLAAGLVVRNAAPEAAHAMETLLLRVRLPVLVVFFGAAGASLHLEHLLRLWPVALGLTAIRAVLVRAGSKLGAHSAGLPEPVAGATWLGLISQAGVTFGLVILVGRDFGTWGRALETLCLATIALNQLWGPVALKWALGKLGEIPPAEPVVASRA